MRRRVVPLVGLLAAGIILAASLADPSLPAIAAGDRDDSRGSPAVAAVSTQAQMTLDPRRGRTDQQPQPVARRQARPNILMFVTDDMRADELKYMPKVRSLLGTNGTTWTNSVSPYPLCCPARASIFSGQYTHNHRVYSHKDPYGFNAFDDRRTLATLLQDAGYRTALLGKYLNGYGDQPLHGKTSGRSVRYTPPGWNDWQGAITGGLANSRFDGGAYRYWDTTLSRNRGRGFKNLSMYQTYGYGKIEKRFVARAARSSRPFFSYVGFTAPHHGTPRDPDDPGPVTRDDGQVQKFKSPAVPEPLRGTFDWVISAAPGADWHDPDPSDQPEEMQPGQMNPPNAAERAAMTEITRQRAESLKAVDNTIADVLATLESSGELDRTYIIFTSDNGYFLGEQGIRQGKVLPYESALRTPLLIRGPGIPRGEVRTDPFSSVDFAPTILRMAGQSVPSRIDGGSRLSVAKNGDRGWVRPVLVNTGPASIVRDTDDSARVLETDDPGAPDKRYLLGVRTGRYLYTERASGFKELYDVLVDPNQYDNLIDDPAHQDVRVALRDQLEQIRSCSGRSCRPRLPASLRTGP
ncbi:MAG: sulfatase [Nocardioides sp.]